MFISTIESGTNHTRPDKPLTFYTGKTDVYQLPFWDVNATPSSASEKTRFVETIENQILGVYRNHINGDTMVVRNGFFIDASNHPENMLIGILSGTQALIGNIFTGDRFDTGKELVFSGLSHGGTNYLWGSLVENNPEQLDFQSSRQFCDIAARITPTFDPPSDPSVFFGTYTSGSGFNNTLVPVFVTVKEHVEDNQNPHGPILSQDEIVSSGVFVYNAPVKGTQIPLETISPSYAPYSLVNLHYNMHVRMFGNNIVEGDFLGTTISGTDIRRSLYGSTEYQYGDLVFGTFEGGHSTSFNLSLGSNLTQIDSTLSQPHGGNEYQSMIFYRDAFNGANLTGNSDVVVDALNIMGFTVYPQNRQIPIGTGAVSSEAPAGSATYTFPFTVSSIANRVLYLVLYYENSGASLTNVTFDGNAMDQRFLVGFQPGSSYICTVYRYVNPDSGLKDIDVDLNSSVVVMAFIVEFNNINQTTPDSTDGIVDYNSLTNTDTVNLTEPTASNPTLLDISTVSGTEIAALGNVVVTSGLDIYPQSTFRGNLNISSGLTVGGLDMSLMPRYVSNVCISGYPHIHSPFHYTSGLQVVLTPEFKGSVVAPPNSTKFKYNFDLDQAKFKPTLKHEYNSFEEILWIRHFIPQGYNQVDSLNIQHKCDSGTRVNVSILDCLGVEHIPERGNILFSSSAVRNTVVSGIPQSGFTDMQPFDIKLAFQSISGTAQYIGDITINFTGKYSE